MDASKPIVGSYSTDTEDVLNCLLKDELHATAAPGGARGKDAKQYVDDIGSDARIFERCTKTRIF